MKGLPSALGNWEGGGGEMMKGLPSALGNWEGGGGDDEGSTFCTWELGGGRR